MRCFRAAGAALFFSLLMPASGRAYITSAVLEFCADDTSSFHLNGNVLCDHCVEHHPFHWAAVSTADGSLPLELFKENEDNVLAVENFDTEAGQMQIAYRLTVYHSDGDPVVVWSDAEGNRFLHLALEQKNPVGWTQPKFDDSKWGQALNVNMPGPWCEMARLPDPAFDGLLGGGAVPYLVHRGDAMCRGGDHNLFRSHFRFPNNPAKVEVRVTPKKVVAGQTITVSMVPGPDATEISNFNMLAYLPKNVQITGASKGARYDEALRRASWVQSNREMRVSYLELHAEKVVASGGWGDTGKALGKNKKMPRRGTGIPRVLLEQGSVPTQGLEAWFKMSAPQVDFSLGTPKIQGVMFHTEMKASADARDVGGKRDIDKVMINYSVNGKMERAMKQDFNVARTSCSHGWMDGYYHASEDRDWTWEDMKNLMVMYEVKQVGQRDKMYVGSMICKIRYYYPELVKPTLYAKVIEKGCADVVVKTTLFRQGSKPVSSDPFVLKANEHLCQPSPVPTRIPTAVPIAQARPQPTSTPVPPDRVQSFANLGLGCLGVRPDPFDYGGAFINFCLKIPAEVTLNIYDLKTGLGLRRIVGGEFRDGDSQIFFNALDDQGKLLLPGRYTYELVARDGKSVETRNSTLNIVKKRKKNT